MRIVIIIAAVVVLLTGCSAGEGFTEKEAIAKVLASSQLDHEASNYPIKPGNRIVRAHVSFGPNQSKIDVTYSTKSAKAGKATYIVTLTKNYNIVLNGNDIVSYQVFKATPENIEMITSEDNSRILETAK